MTEHRLNRRNDYPLYTAPKGTQNWREPITCYSRVEAESWVAAHVSSTDTHKITRRNRKTGEETLLETGDDTKASHTLEEARDHVIFRIDAADEHGHAWDMPAILRELHTLAGSWDLGQVSDEELWNVIYRHNQRTHSTGQGAP